VGCKGRMRQQSILRNRRTSASPRTHPPRAACFPPLRRAHTLDLALSRASEQNPAPTRSDEDELRSHLWHLRLGRRPLLSAYKVAHFSHMSDPVVAMSED
jgi:hypothetical protein